MTASAHRPTLGVQFDVTDHRMGPEHAGITIVEYGDFECPSCKVAAPSVKLLLDRFPNKIRFAFRHYPMEDAHPHALMAAEVSECAAAQGQFWAMYDLLFQNQQHLKPKDLRAYAERLGMDMARYTVETDDHIYLQKVREHVDGGHRSHIRATPTFFVNGAVQDISYGMQGFHDTVARVVSRG